MIKLSHHPLRMNPENTQNRRSLSERSIGPEYKTEAIQLAEPIIEEVDISGGWDRVSQVEILMNRVKHLGRYKKNLLFRGTDGSKLETVRLYGIDHPDEQTVFCST